MNLKDDIVTLIKKNLPFAADRGVAIGDDTILADLGMDSLHLITMLLILQRQYGIEIERVAETGMPATVAELVALVDEERAGKPAHA
ncbi:MAG: acyl carrier protein [Pseudomonadota bacterium]|nr:acyl carrier protein [Pseudomonadota bacterium]